MVLLKSFDIDVLQGQVTCHFSILVDQTRSQNDCYAMKTHLIIVVFSSGEQPV